jgi:O-antigen ligase
MTAIRAGVREPLLILVGAAGMAMFTTAACLKVGPAGLVLPLAAALAIVLLRHPAVALGGFVGLVVLFEGRDNGLLPIQSEFYAALLPGSVTAQELAFAFVILAVAIDALTHERPLRLPRGLGLPLALLTLAILAGAVTAHYSGTGTKDILFAARKLPYLIVMPVLVMNVIHTRKQLMTALTVAVALGVVKAVLGLLTVASGRGTSVDGATITYYEPAANFLMMVLVVGVLALWVMGRKPSIWLIAGALLMLLSLALSFRRSFWIGIVLAVLLVVVLGVSPLGRRLMLPAAVLVALALWAVASVGFQESTQAPLVSRATSLAPSKIEANAEDRYRLDERANVLAELRRHPVSGLGLAVPWSASARPLGVEHEGGRTYVHSISLWYWMSLGILGLVAYVSLMLGAGWQAARTWRRHRDPLMRAFGLAALGSLVGIAVIETTGSFTGVDLRFTVVMGAFLGLLAWIRRDADVPA